MFTPTEGVGATSVDDYIFGPAQASLTQYAEGDASWGLYNRIATANPNNGRNGGRRTAVSPTGLTDTIPLGTINQWGVCGNAAQAFPRPAPDRSERLHRSPGRCGFGYQATCGRGH